METCCRISGKKSKSSELLSFLRASSTPTHAKQKMVGTSMVASTTVAFCHHLTVCQALCKTPSVTLSCTLGAGMGMSWVTDVEGAGKWSNMTKKWPICPTTATTVQHSLSLLTAVHGFSILAITGAFYQVSTIDRIERVPTSTSSKVLGAQ